MSEELQKVRDECEKYFTIARWIIVLSSVLHIWTVFFLFSSGGGTGFVSTMALTAMLDMSLIALVQYLALMRFEKKRPHKGLLLLFYLVLFNAGMMNVLSIWTHRPPPDVLNEYVSMFFSVVMGFTTSFLLAGLSLPVDSSADPVKLPRVKKANVTPSTPTKKPAPAVSGRKRGRPRKNPIPVLNP